MRPLRDATGRPENDLQTAPVLLVACRKAAFEDRRSHKTSAVAVNVVEKTVAEIRERRIPVPHPSTDCIHTVFADDDALAAVVPTLIDEIRNPNSTGFSPGHDRFWDLYTNVEVLH